MTKTLPVLALIAGIGAISFGAIKVTSPSVSKVAPAASTKITGDYLEARTAAVFAGACHYNGELVTTGRDAVMAWDFQSGSWNGVSLNGVRAMAVVTSEFNLGDSDTARKSELLVDSSASSAQVQAVADLLRARSGDQLGTINAIRRGEISFVDNGHHYAVSADGFGSMTVDPMPNDECCKQPNDVWFSPLNPVPNRKVGYTQVANYTAGSIAEPWQRVDENGAFYGQFEY
jgi:hypothetical protein